MNSQQGSKTVIMDIETHLGSVTTTYVVEAPVGKVSGEELKERVCSATGIPKHQIKLYRQSSKKDLKTDEYLEISPTSYEALGVDILLAK